MHKDILAINKNISFKSYGTKDGDFLPILQQKLVCELDGHSESYCFKWKLMIDSDVVDSGAFKDVEVDEEETDRFLNILNKFSEFKVKQVLKWYRGAKLSRSTGIIITRPYVCSEISDYRGSFIDRLRMKVANSILSRFIYKNTTVDVPFFNETNQLRIRFEQEGIQFIATMTLEDEDDASIDIIALDNDRVVEMEWKRNFFLWDLEKFVRRAIKNYHDVKNIKQNIQKTICDICQKAIENHIFETLDDGKIAIKRDIEEGVGKLVESNVISSYETRCKLFGTELYVNVSCSKDGKFEDLQIETLTPLIPKGQKFTI